MSKVSCSTKSEPVTNEVSRSVVRVGSSVEERDIMKSKKSRRTLPLTEDVREYLLKLKAEQAADKLLLGAGYVDSDFICRWRDGNQLSPDFVTHKFTTGFSLKEIAECLGHEDIASTNRYSHLEYASKQGMAGSVNEMLSMKRRPAQEAEQTIQELEILLDVFTGCSSMGALFWEREKKKPPDYGLIKRFFFGRSGIIGLRKTA